MIKQCKNCYYFPDSCNYWDMSQRKNVLAGDVAKIKRDNCPEFMKRLSSQVIPRIDDEFMAKHRDQGGERCYGSPRNTT